jgi:serine-type D-Ala-D-Ala carboxypeptidase (penicillin-binding protein 5/6)
MTERPKLTAIGSARRRSRFLAIAVVLIVIGATAAVAVALWTGGKDNGGSTSTSGGVKTTAATRANGIPGASGSAAIGESTDAPTGDLLGGANLRFALQPVSGPLPVQYRFKHPPVAGVLFDVKTGQVLWQRNPRLQHPIASLTKMMTALMVASGDPPQARVRISAKAAHTPGSATGLLPRGKKVPLEPLLQALIMISANDAAVALAEHDAGTVPRFVKDMNRNTTAMGLSCTHFSTPNGLRDRNNYSCAQDLAELARADLANPTIARIAQTRYAKPRFPIKGKHLYLSNNHYFLQRGLTGIPQAQVTGLKTGFTDAAGRCYVTTARVGSHHLGVVVLDSPNPLTQVPALLRAGFIEMGAIPPAPPAPAAPQPNPSPGAGGRTLGY